MEIIKKQKPRFDLMMSTGDHMILNTMGEKEMDGQKTGGKYLLTIDEFGQPIIEKELRNYG